MVSQVQYNDTFNQLLFADHFTFFTVDTFDQISDPSEVVSLVVKPANPKIPNIIKINMGNR